MAIAALALSLDSLTLGQDGFKARVGAPASASPLVLDVSTFHLFLCRPGWPLNHRGPPASDSGVPELEVCATTPGFNK